MNTAYYKMIESEEWFMCKCIICNREIKDTDDYELYGYDGDKIHKHCKSKCEEYTILLIIWPMMNLQTT